ncbi:MAG TPA: tRNA (adenosine(37)-N6)-threonylcarbamoyltransferase complex ATPase subunit type 1 TsaE [Gammaproteobacteria bacterium]|nr:tRNA (adenosine(37)-N6)-threonylcarbamoyltransferase complex ATPase subunit type 1 TsaE [Gammaproteobacteria bacterium]
MKQIEVKGGDAMQAFGAGLSKEWFPTVYLPLIVFFKGDLGSGKTTLAQGILAELGVTEAVTSPTYTIIEQYDADIGLISHLDLYRLEQPSDISALGFEDIYSDSALVLIEWPEKATQYLPQPNYIVECLYIDSATRNVNISTIK